MKHLTTLLVLIISLCACTQTPTEETFVNPLFYEQLYPFNYYHTYKLTPTSLTTVCLANLPNFPCVQNYSCEMLANNEYTVILKCSKILPPQITDPEELKRKTKLFKFTLEVTEQSESQPDKLSVMVKEKYLAPKRKYWKKLIYYINITPDLERYVPSANVFLETDYSSGQAFVNIKHSYE
jgi:hypothetical protein